MLTDCFNKNRNFVMGMSIIFIVLLHTHFQLPFVLHFFRRMGYIYVDLFMLLSGYGLFFSFSKCQSISQFYKKRVIRILPTYYILAIVFLIFKIATTNVLFIDIIGVLTTMSFWSGSELVFSWFAQSLVAFYVLSPLLIKSINHFKNPWWVFLGIVILTIPFIATPRLYMAISRIPPFVCGMCMAKVISVEGEGWMNKRKPHIYLSMLVGLGLLFFFKFYFQELVSEYYGKTFYLVFLPATLMAPGLAVILSNICNFIERIKFNLLVNEVEYLGKYTFEIYLVQSLFYMILFHYWPKVSSDGNSVWLVIMIIAFAMGCVFGRLIEQIQKMIKSRVL